MPLRPRDAPPLRARSLWLHRPLAAVVLVAGILVALVIGRGLAAAEREQAEVTFEGIAAEYVDDFERAFARTLVAIGGVADLVAIEGIDAAEEFAVAGGLVQQREPSLPAIAVARAVDDVAAWERATGHVGLVRPTRSGPAVFLEHIAPADGDHAAALGFDLASEGHRRAAIAAAIDRGAPVASAPVAIVPVRPGDGLGATLMLPTYDGGVTPSSVPGRRSLFSGAVVAVLSPKVVLDGLATPDVRVEVWDVGTSAASGPGGSVTGGLVAESPTHMVSSDGVVMSDDEAEGLCLRRKLTIDVAGRTWLLVVDDLTGMAESGSAWLRFGVPTGGSIIAVLLAALVLLGGESLRRTRDDRALLEERVAARTADLAEVAGALERANLELEDFVYGAAHDLRTPLAVVHGTLAWVAERVELDDLEDELVERARRATDRMRDRIDTLVGDAHDVAARTDAEPADGGDEAEAESLPSASTAGV